MSNQSAKKPRDTADFSFHGGIRLKGHKGESTQTPISHPPLPKKLVLPLRQHMGQDLIVQVAVGDHVLKGQMLACSEGPMSAALHSPTSGLISAIEERPFPHPSGLAEQSIEITSDGENRWTALSPVGESYRNQPREDLLPRLRDSGIVGLGGAVFPTSMKIESGVAQHVETLVINGAECEPWISCDQALMQEKADEILRGIEVCLYLSGAESCLVGIEDNKPRAIEAMKHARNNTSLPVSIVTIPTIYPTGGERQLIKVLTDLAVPVNGYPADIGMLVLNVATAWSIGKFILNGEPLISRIVTVTGDGVVKPQNVEALIGTPMSALIAHAGGYTAAIKQLTMGGPMMGFSLPSDSLPVVKASNCLLAQTAATLSHKQPALPCIRCGACSDICPVDLLPQQLYWYSRAKKLDALERYNIRSCIECGCCDYVCPSHIPLAHYFRFAKAEIRGAQIEQQKADIARLRHEARVARLERIQQQKAEKLAAKKAALEARQTNPSGEKQNPIADAMERSKKRKQALQDKQAATNNPPEEPGQSIKTTQPGPDPESQRAEE